MKTNLKTTIHDAGTNMADASTEATKQGQPVVAAITAGASALMLTLMGINDTLEEIRDAIRGEK